MASKNMYALTEFRYGTRMLKPGNRVEMTGPDARLYEGLGKVSPKRPPKPEAAVAPAPAPTPTPTPAPTPTPPPPPPPADDMTALREEYFTKMGKRAYNGWDAETLREKMKG